jgi:hypothetical protein
MGGSVRCYQSHCYVDYLFKSLFNLSSTLVFSNSSFVSLSIFVTGAWLVCGRFKSYESYSLYRVCTDTHYFEFVLIKVKFL